MWVFCLYQVKWLIFNDVFFERAGVVFSYFDFCTSKFLCKLKLISHMTDSDCCGDSVSNVYDRVTLE